MKPLNNGRKHENGSVVVVALVILVLLTIIGTSLTNTTTLEMQIAGNDARHKMAFYEADGGTEVASELLEENLGCPTGFTDTGGGEADLRAVTVTNLDFWSNSSDDIPDDEQTASDDYRDIFYPGSYGSAPHSNLRVVGTGTHTTPGSAIQMVSGYEGKGKGSGGGGGYMTFDIYSQYTGISNSRSAIMITWRHIIGQEGDCNY